MKIPTSNNSSCILLFNAYVTRIIIIKVNKSSSMNGLTCIQSHDLTYLLRVCENKYCSLINLQFSDAITVVSISEFSRPLIRVRYLLIAHDCVKLRQGTDKSYHKQGLWMVKVPYAKLSYLSK